MHREVAPGAEEFIPPSVGLWLPPERTFSQVSRCVVRARAARSSRRSRSIGSGPTHVIVGFRAFAEQVEDQVVTRVRRGPR